MNDWTEITWLVGQLTIVVLAVWLVLKTVFFRRASQPQRAKRSSHVGDGILMLVIAPFWAGLCYLVWMGAAFAGASATVTTGILMVGGGILLVILWGAVRHLWQAFGQPHGAPPNPQQDLPGKPVTPSESTRSDAAKVEDRYT